MKTSFLISLLFHFRIWINIFGVNLMEKESYKWSNPSLATVWKERNSEMKFLCNVCDKAPTILTPKVQNEYGCCYVYASYLFNHPNYCIDISCHFSKRIFLNQEEYVNMFNGVWIIAIITRWPLENIRHLLWKLR